mgnify:CR=1 FL=1
MTDSTEALLSQTTVPVVMGVAVATTPKAPANASATPATMHARVGACGRPTRGTTRDMGESHGLHI